MGNRVRTPSSALALALLLTLISTTSLTARAQSAIATLGGEEEPTVPAAAPPGLNDVKISEFRVQGANGEEDDFVEIYNNTDAALTVTDASLAPTATPGWAVVSAEAPTEVKCRIPSGEVIPARGHFLCAGAGYNLHDYGGTGAGNPDASISADLPLNRGLALFRSTNPVEFTPLNRLDAVGPDSETVLLFKEGTGYRALPATVIPDHSWVRRLPGGCTGSYPGEPNQNCTTPTLVANTPPPTSGNPQDTDNNANDFIFVDTEQFDGDGEDEARLGAPGPENLASPIVRTNPDGTGGIRPSLIDPAQASNAAPNRVVTPGTPQKLDIRRKFTNYTGAPVTRLRFRIMDITTLPVPAGIADLRAQTSPTSGSVPVTGGGTVTVFPTTLEETAPVTAGGGFNSTLSAGSVTLQTPLAAADDPNTPEQENAINLSFYFLVPQGGKYRVFVTVEALP